MNRAAGYGIADHAQPPGDSRFIVASFTFKKQNSGTQTRQYSVEECRMGSNLGHRKQMSGADMVKMPLWQGKPRNWPVGTDNKAPVLPGER